MRYCAKTKGFSTIEILTAIAIVVVLVSILLGVGKRIQSQAEEKLAKGMIDVLVSGLEQYYDYHGEFPFEAGAGFDQSAFEQSLDPPGDLDGDGNDDDVQIIVLSGLPLVADWSSSSLYYYLSRTPSSSVIIDTLTDGLIDNKDLAGDDLIIEITIGSNLPYEVDLIRFIDPWGNTILYTYVMDDNFPLIVSAGPDGVMGTDDDMDSR